MKIKLIAAFAAVLALTAAPAFAQQVVAGSVRSTAPTYVNGETRPISLTTGGALRVTSADSGASSQTVQGPAADSTPVVGNPVLNGCVYVATSVIVDAGDVASCQATQRGSIKVTLYDTGAGPISLIPITGAVAAGTGNLAVSQAPSSAAGGAIAPTATSAVAASLVAKASAGNLYDWQVTSGASAGYVLLFNATSAPADGAVTPVQCVAVAANSTVGSSMHGIPERYSTGITVVFSTTGCFTKTSSATAFIRARAM